MNTNALNMSEPAHSNSKPGLLQLDAWFEQVSQDRTAKERDTLIRAFKLAQQRCQDKLRPTGEPAINHVFTVLDLLAQLNMDTDTLIASILHDPVETGDLDVQTVRQQFGDAVAKMVDGVNKMGFLSELKLEAEENLNNQGQNQQTENLRRMILAMVEDVRVMLIKLAERLHEMRMLRHLSAAQQRRIAHETLDIFAPLANRLGIWQIKWELEDLSLRYLQPEQYKQIASLLQERRTDREAHIAQMMQQIRETLEQAGIQAQVMGRPKHIYSIWEKMQRKQLDYHELYDVLAVRVIVNTEQECYLALGLIHKQSPPVPGEFDDYIANPKINDYSSLHTAVIGPNQQTFEVQIRTQQMHHHSELGVASHWRYKEGSHPDEDFERKIAWMRQVLTWQDEEVSAGDFIRRFQSELHEARVYVRSPEGKIIDLPSGATPIDFAYYIHTELGHRCRGARVNGRIMPLTYPLHTGDQVEIIKSEHARPNRRWLDEQLGYVKTSRALTRIKQWLKQQDDEHHVAEGRSALNRELYRLNVADANLSELAEQFDFEDLEGFLAAIGRGDLETSEVVTSFGSKLLPHHAQPRTLRSHPLMSHSSAVDDAHIKMFTADCCHPEPHQAITGYFTSRGVEVHRSDCLKVITWKAANHPGLVTLNWESLPEQSYAVDIEIKADDRFGLVRDISSILSDARVNIMAMQTQTDKENIANMVMSIEIRNLRQLSKALLQIENLHHIYGSPRVINMKNSVEPIN
ncbi:RelA/SpoT family protein [Candidatus Venteria ishoeyi]|uniref:GTP pyrophosphokinase n=1 Tax=Candidatus Venteria ishoeyi TaxID=1899563 RepID=A0A1H6FIT0_9GAMM|nr:bifunctional (p)ppGpp synthetase/guanosine-3',5'-bis(diphosphate) 3'-pyrophosphohydrolase [Candidatus Venteria ishoeyi]SEH08924.1 GTP pyrophosphokinase [Candidatus Venteria ishoeyi]